MQRIILHSDMNCFYASVEMMLNSELRGKAVAVCGSTENRHGIVLAKSELAKKAGIKTGMVNWQAEQLCPNLILVPPHYDEYIKYSKMAHEIYGRYTNLVEPYGMDECWLDVTGVPLIGNTGSDIAESIRKTVKEELGLTVSIGVSYNKIFAKLGSDMKKPDAITSINPKDMKTKVWSLPVSDLLYVGRASTRKLKRYGIHTIGDLANTDPQFLKRILGVNGVEIWRFANGEDTSRVMPMGYTSQVKSIGHGVTCISDLNCEEEVWRVMLELSQDIGHRLRVHELAATGVQVTIRDKELNFVQYQMPLKIATQSPSDIAKGAREIFNRKYPWTSMVRAVTVRAINLVQHASPQQMDFFVNVEKLEKQQKLDDTVEEIRRRFGKRAIYSASLHKNLKMPFNGADSVKIPGAMYR